MHDVPQGGVMCFLQPQDRDMRKVSASPAALPLHFCRLCLQPRLPPHAQPAAWDTHVGIDRTGCETQTGVSMITAGATWAPPRFRIMRVSLCRATPASRATRLQMESTAHVRRLSSPALHAAGSSQAAIRPLQACVVQQR